ncbi:probable G-protein coupled receptor B0563.6 [Gigantopelta aegis]|uniref:probable G-protein coupled receptor B0563.6 n=1 Tax=Gigantopelta aegis TaxID=1735272 RepID=UPI001B88D86C|nr:probable G-protein coupled receptor B0563.6 [Gigantopelta aegis]
MNLSHTTYIMFPVNTSGLFKNFNDFTEDNTSTWIDLHETLLNQSNFVTYSTEMPIFHQNEEIFASKGAVRKFLFVFGMILIPTFSLFGSIGNLVSIVVLVHHRMRNTTNYCLAALALSDLLFLIHSLWFAIINIYKSRDPIRGDNLRVLTYPVLGAYGSVVTARITSWLTSMLSVDRFIAVYCPMKAKTICSKRLTCVAIFVIYTITAVTFIPLALKYTTYKQATINNQTYGILKLTKTALGRDKQFLTIYGIFLNIFFRFLPCIVLIILNILIMTAIRKTWNLRRIMSKSSSSSGRQYEQNRITVMLLIVTFVFVLCILPGAINITCSQIWQEYSRLGRNRNLYLCISNVTYFLETVNSSINFIIYMAFSAKFCKTYKEIFCCVPASQLHRTSTREVIRFSRRPRDSSSSMTSFRDYKVSFVREAQRGITEGVECVQNSRHLKARFDVEQIKLLCYNRGKKMSDNDLESNQYS